MTDVWEWELIAEHGVADRGSDVGRQRAALQRVLRVDDFSLGSEDRRERGVAYGHEPGERYEVRPVGAAVRV